MQRLLPLSFFVLVFGVCISFSQQAEADAAKLKEERRAKLIERVAADTDQLKLPENRAILTARVGAIVWATDPERVKKMFRAAIADLLIAQLEAEAARGKAHLYYDLLNSQNTRPQILNTIATVDAEFALESFYRTRPAFVARAMAGDTLKTKIDLGQTDRHLAQGESNLEQRISRLLADQKPEKAIAILKENVKKRLSNETYETLKKLYAAAPSAAQELADEVVSRLNTAAFYTDNQADHALMQISTSIITDHIRERSPDEKYLAFGDSGVRQLAVKVIDTYIKHGPQIGWVPFEQLEPFAKRYAPGSIERLRTAAQSGRNGFNHHRGITTNAEYNNLMGTNPTADQMVQAAGSFTPDLQRQLYQNAANKFSETGQYHNAVALLNDKFEGDALDQAVSSLNWYYAHHLIQKGEFDAAEAMMLEFNDSNRISALTSLAQTIYGKNPSENRARAAALLQRVRGLMPERPETSNEVNQMFALIGAMTPIEPADAFANLEPMVDHLNGLVQAFAIVQSYHGTQLRQGEYNLGMGSNFGVYFDLNLFRNLAQADFNRTNAIIDSFERPELRISMRMFLAEGL
jgi:hypothetical protein